MFELWTSREGIFDGEMRLEKEAKNLKGAKDIYLVGPTSQLFQVCFLDFTSLDALVWAFLRFLASSSSPISIETVFSTSSTILAYSRRNIVYAHQPLVLSLITQNMQIN